MTYLHSVHLSPYEIRGPLEYPKTLHQAKCTGLQAEVDATAGRYKLKAMAWLPLSEIIVRTPREVWIYSIGE